MTDIAQRYATVSAGFTARVHGVPEGRWDDPAPCEGWVARDVVRHLVDWVPGTLFAPAGLPVPEIPSVDDDPVAAWDALDTALSGILADDEIVAREFDSPMGRLSVGDAVARFGVGDILVHTWDLARATGQDETLDEASAAGMLSGLEPLDAMIRNSGMFGPRVEVPADASVQDRLIAFTGRQP